MKSLSKIALAAGLISAGCNYSEQVEKASVARAEKFEAKFSHFGYVDKSYQINHEVSGITSIVGITGADFDGDGDADIAIVDKVGRITIYRNDIPQKK